MTRFKESAQRTVSTVTKQRCGWVVTFIDGSCRLINKDQKKGTTKIEPGKTIISCSTRCTGPDEQGKCTWRPRGPRSDKYPIVDCSEQFVYVGKPKHFGKAAPKFERSAQKMSYRIKSFKTIKGRLYTDSDKWEVVFENGTKGTFLKTDQLGHQGLKHHYHLVPCGEDCVHRGGACIHCYGDRKGTECAQQFYFCRKFIGRHKHDKRR